MCTNKGRPEYGGKCGIHKPKSETSKVGKKVVASKLLTSSKPSTSSTSSNPSKPEYTNTDGSINLPKMLHSISNMPLELTKIIATYLSNDRKLMYELKDEKVVYDNKRAYKIWINHFCKGR